jgi:hypothetical protein
MTNSVAVLSNAKRHREHRWRAQGTCCRCFGESNRPLTYWGLCTPCYRHENTVQFKARKIFCEALRRGKFPSAKTKRCVDCGCKARDWDHRDYLKPLEVEPVCRSCNQKRGPAKFTPFFLPKGFKTRHLLTQMSEAVDCAALTLMVSP